MSSQSDSLLVNQGTSFIQSYNPRSLPLLSHYQKLVNIKQSDTHYGAMWSAYSVIATPFCLVTNTIMKIFFSAMFFITHLFSFVSSLIGGKPFQANILLQHLIGESAGLILSIPTDLFHATVLEIFSVLGIFYPSCLFNNPYFILDKLVHRKEL